MNKASISFLEVEKKLMQDKKFRNEYEKNKPYYERVSSNIKEKITFLEATVIKKFYWWLKGVIKNIKSIAKIK